MMMMLMLICGSLRSVGVVGFLLFPSQACGTAGGYGGEVTTAPFCPDPLLPSDVQGIPRCVQRLLSCRLNMKTPQHPWQTGSWGGTYPSHIQREQNTESTVFKRQSVYDWITGVSLPLSFVLLHVTLSLHAFMFFSLFLPPSFPPTSPGLLGNIQNSLELLL